MRDFEEWLGNMRSSINDYTYYVDFEKVYENVEKIRIELNIMNSLIGSANIKEDFKALYTKYPEILKCIPTLLAVRKNEIYAQDGDGVFNYNFKRYNYSIDQYIIFMEKTGLMDLIANHLVNNLVDYALGIETGLDSNGRKNRGGHRMEHLVECYIKRENVEYYKEMSLSEVEEKWNIDLSAITATKRWDFVVKTLNHIYLMEINFYSSGGSKLNEVARSYKMIFEETNKIDGVDFIWITDGGGWTKARKNLKETFDVMPFLFNINDMENGVLQLLFK